MIGVGVALAAFAGAGAVNFARDWKRAMANLDRPREPWEV